MHEANIKIEESKENLFYEDSKHFEIEWPNNNQNSDEIKLSFNVSKLVYSKN